MQAASEATAAAARSVWSPLKSGGSGFPGPLKLPLNRRIFGLPAFAARNGSSTRSSKRISVQAGCNLCTAYTRHHSSSSSCSSVLTYTSVTPLPPCLTTSYFLGIQQPFPVEGGVNKSQALSRSFFSACLRAATHSGTHAAQVQQHEQSPQQHRQKRNLHQQQKPKQQQHEQQTAGVFFAEGIAYPEDYSTLPSACSSSTETSSNSSRKTSAPEQLGLLPLWARRFQPPQRETLFLRILPVAPLVAMALGVHLLPPLGLEELARDCLSALIAYSATLLTANAAVHVGMQLAELGFPPHRQHRGFYTVGRLGVSLFFVIHSLLVCGLVHDEPLSGIYLCCASSLGLLGVDYLLYTKATTPLWFVTERRRLCLWMVMALGVAALSEQQAVDSKAPRTILG